MSLWVKSDHFGVLADVRYYPQSDRDCDKPAGRYVPLATKVHCSKVRYSITSAARANSDGGTVRPSALAVLMLITS